jgi:hypothetical protein
LKYRTNPGRRDSDFDGIRDGVEIGLSESDILSQGGTTKSFGSWIERTLRYSNPYNYNSILNYDLDTISTDPLDPDSDDDGLPDGWIDGWVYHKNNIDVANIKSFEQSLQINKDVSSWQYDELHWGRSGIFDSVISIYEGEDFNCDGKYDQPTEWMFERDILSRNVWSNQNWIETNSFDYDSEDDTIPDGYEVYFSIQDPILDINGNLYLDPLTSDNNLDLEIGTQNFDPGINPNHLYDRRINNNDNYGKYVARAQRIMFRDNEIDLKDFTSIKSICINVDKMDISCLKFEIWTTKPMIDPIEGPIPGVKLYSDENFIHSYSDQYRFKIPSNIFDSSLTNTNTDIYGIPYYFFVIKSKNERSPFQCKMGDYSSTGYLWEINNPISGGVNPESYQYDIELEKWTPSTNQYIYYELEMETSTIGDSLTNGQEYLIGTNPKSSNSDELQVRIGGSYTNEKDDGSEVGIDPLGVLSNTIFYTNVKNGGYYFDNYGHTSDFVEYDPDGISLPIQGLRYVFENTIINPTFGGHDCLSPTNIGLFRLINGEVSISTSKDYIYVSQSNDFSSNFGLKDWDGKGNYHTGMLVNGKFHVFKKFSNSLEINNPSWSKS